LRASYSQNRYPLLRNTQLRSRGPFANLTH
jgi:hypothetical protein